MKNSIVFILCFTSALVLAETRTFKGSIWKGGEAKGRPAWTIVRVDGVVPETTRLYEGYGPKDAGDTTAEAEANQQFYNVREGADAKGKIVYQDRMGKVYAGQGKSGDKPVCTVVSMDTSYPKSIGSDFTLKGPDGKVLGRYVAQPKIGSGKSEPGRFYLGDVQEGRPAFVFSGYGTRQLLTYVILNYFATGKAGEEPAADEAGEAFAMEAPKAVAKPETKPVAKPAPKVEKEEEEDLPF